MVNMMVNFLLFYCTAGAVDVDCSEADWISLRRTTRMLLLLRVRPTFRVRRQRLPLQSRLL